MHWIWDLFLVLYQHLTFRFKWHVSKCRSCTFHLPLAVQVLVLHSVTERKKSRKRKRAKEREKKGENGKKYNLSCYHYSPPKKKLRVREITVIFTHHFLGLRIPFPTRQYPFGQLGSALLAAISSQSPGQCGSMQKRPLLWVSPTQ